MQMTGLIALYKDIKSQNVTYAIFDYKHNRIQLAILFDIKTTPFSLLLVKKHSNQNLSFDVKKGFCIDLLLSSERYECLRRMLEIPSGSTNRFRPSEFFRELNAKIPSHIPQYKLDDSVRMAIAYSKNFEDKDKIFVRGLIDWDKIRNGKTYTRTNREKTRILYPNIYDKIKDKNISVSYTNNKIDAQNHLVLLDNKK